MSRRVVAPPSLRYGPSGDTLLAAAWNRLCGEVALRQAREKIASMQDRELYRQILGIQSPWSVERVELELSKGEVRVYFEHEADIQWPCVECGQSCPLYDHQSERRWRHLDTCQYRTILHAKVPRSDCPEHGARV